MCSDARAASGVMQRQGLERLRHVECNCLFVQSRNARKVVQYAKVLGSDNLAEIFTMGLNAELMTKHVSAVDGRHSAGFSAKQLLDAELS